MGDNTRCGALDDYRSLTDPHLTGYFSTGRMRRHLRRAGLIRKNGEILSETTYQLNLSRKEEIRKENNLLLRAISDKKRELEREQHALVARTVDDIAKMEKVLRVKQNAKKEQYLPKIQRIRSAPEGRKFRVGAVDGCTSCFGQVGGPGAQRAHPDDKSELDFDAAIFELFSIHGDDGVREKRRAVHDVPVRLPNSKSPYAEKRIPSVLLPRAPKRPTRPQSSPAKRYSLRRVSKKPRVIKKAGGMLDKNSAPTGNVKVTMCYYGTSVNLESDRIDRRDDVVVEQQHCGGNTLTVFRGKILPGEEFSFVSRRHREFPFSATLYVNGATDCRLSACCEYRHRLTARLGARGGHFAVTKVRGGAPCMRCQAQYAKKHGGGGRWRDGTGFSWNGSSEFEESDDDMLYIPVESDEDISVRPVDSGESDSSCSSSEEEKREGDDYDNKSDRSRLESDNEGSQSEGRDDGGLKISVPSSSGKSQPSASSSNDSDDDDRSNSGDSTN